MDDEQDLADSLSAGDDLSAQDLLTAAGGSGGGPTVVYPRMIGPTPEVSMRQAEGYYQDALGRYKQSSGKVESATTDYKAAAERSKMLLQDAIDRLRAEKYDKSRKWFALAQAFGTPTQGGGLLGVAPHVAKALMESGKDKEDWQRKHDELLTKYGAGVAGIDNAYSARALQAAQSNRTADSSQVNAALGLIGRVSKPVVLNPKVSGGGSGTGAGSMNLGADYQARYGQGYLAGVPVPDFDPFAAIADPAKKAVAVRMQTQSDLGSFEKEYGPAVASAKSANYELDAMLGLLETGKVSSGSLAANLQEVGVPVPSMFFNKADQEYNKHALRLARMQRQPGEGQISNYEGMLFNKMVPGLAVMGGAAKNIAKGMKLANQMAQSYYDFVRNYVQVNGTRAGADKEWETYKESPEGRIFDPNSVSDLFDEKDNLRKDKVAAVQLNKNHVGWQDYFRKRYEDKDPNIKGLLHRGVQGYARGGPVRQRYKMALDAGRAYAGNFAEGGEVDLSPTVNDRITDFLQRYMGVGGPGWDYAGDAARSALGGATFGWGDEGLAGISTLFGGDYEDTLKQERNRMAAFKEGYPKMALTTDLAGGFLAGGVGGVNKVMKAGSALRKFGKASAVGAGTGALAGAGESQGSFMDRLDQARASGLMGAVASPLLSKMGSTGAKYVGQWATGAANSKLLKALRSDIGTERNLVGRYTTAVREGAPSMVLDSGAATRELANEAATRATPGTEQLAKKIAGRVQDQKFRVEGALNKRFAPGDYWADTDKALATVKENADKLYKEAYARPPIPLSKELIALQKTPMGQKAFQAAAQIIRNNPKASVGRVTAAGFPTAYSTEYLAIVRDELERMYKNSGNTTEAAYISGLKKRLTDHMRAKNPVYDEALDTYVDDKRILDALESGKSQFVNMDAGELAQKVAGLNFSEKDAFTSGAINSMFGKIMKDSSNSKNFAAAITNSPEMMDKLETLLGDKAKFKMLKAALERNSQQHIEDTGTLRKMQQVMGTGDSAHSAEQMRVAADVALGTATGHPTWPLMDAVRQLIRMRSISPKVADQVAKALSSGSKDEIVALQEQLTKAGVKMDFFEKLRDIARGGMAVVGGESAAPGAQAAE